MAPPKGDDGLVHKRKVVIVKLNGKLYNSVTTHYDVVGVLHQSSDKEQVQDFISESLFFDTRILSFHKEALRVWRSVSRYYIVKEQDYHTPYSFAETAKLYALDALCLANPLVESATDRFKLAELFTVFYLIVHLFDDHVEHRDKFYSKFDFSTYECSQKSGGGCYI